MIPEKADQAANRKKRGSAGGRPVLERGADNFRYSARLIDGPDNEEGGRRLNSMYTANRILGGDAFYVTVVP